MRLRKSQYNNPSLKTCQDTSNSSGHLCLDALAKNPSINTVLEFFAYVSRHKYQDFSQEVAPLIDVQQIAFSESVRCTDIKLFKPNPLRNPDFDEIHVCQSKINIFQLFKSCSERAYFSCQI